MAKHYIFCLMGKSATGKDTVCRKLRGLLEESGAPELLPVVPYTTRPIRTGEVNGTSYWFESPEEFEAAREAGKIIESRDYETMLGTWHYYTKDDGQIDLSQHSYLIIGTLESYLSFQHYYGADRVIPLYIEVDDGERLRRALHRELGEENPRFSELCRRFLADEEDFSEEKLREAGIARRYENSDSGKTAARMRDEIIAALSEEKPAGGSGEKMDADEQDPAMPCSFGMDS